MRHPLYLALGLTSILAACGGDGGGGDDNDGDSPPPPDGGGGGDLPPPSRGFQVVSPDITIMPGEEITYCYYFRTPNTEEMVIKKWVSAMTPGSHHMIMYTTPSDTMPPGTVSRDSCGNFSATNAPSWTYSAQTPTAEIALPTNDGTGKPLGQRIAPGTPAYFQMHYLNRSDMPIQAHVTLNAEALDAGAPFTQTAPFITFNGQINIPPGATGDVETQTCTTPANARFWSMSTHAHQQAVRTTVKDGASVIFTSTDWEHPGAMSWMTPSFYTFASGRLTYECTYNNTGTNAGRTVTSGSSAETDEMCMAVGYFFPATRSLFCFNSFGPI